MIHFTPPTTKEGPVPDLAAVGTIHTDRVNANSLWWHASEGSIGRIANRETGRQTDRQMGE